MSGSVPAKEIVCNGLVGRKYLGNGLSWWADSTSTDVAPFLRRNSDSSAHFGAGVGWLDAATETAAICARYTSVVSATR
jgi:hypothetical protein